MIRNLLLLLAVTALPAAIYLVCRLVARYARRSPARPPAGAIPWRILLPAGIVLAAATMFALEYGRDL